MFLSVDDLEAGTRLRTRACVVGGGVAGITIARELHRKGVDCVLLESGGLEPDARTQSLYQGKNTGEEYFDLAQCRLRYFGGTSNHWAGNCRMLQPIDFEKREWIPHSGWPFDRDALLPYYERAQDVLQIGEASSDPEDWETEGIRPLGLPGRVRDAVGQFSPTRFGTVYREELRSSEHVRVLFHANALHLDARANGESIESVTVSSLSGRRLTVEADGFIVALGGIENARFLLLSNGVQRQGIGNEHDLVGRYFMEHLSARLGALIPVSRDPSILDFYRPRSRSRADGGTEETFRGYITFPPEIYRKHRINSGHVVLDRSGILPALKRPGYLAFKRLASGQLSLENVGTLVENLQDAARAVSFRVGLPEVSIFHIDSQIEQAPNPESRVKLGEELDELGQRRVELDWRLQEQDLHSVRQMIRILAVAFGQAHVGRVRVEIPESLDEIRDRIDGHFHHMGTTRMHSDPKQGVVDEHCRVHGVNNLYVAGSSVFPTAGFSVPTFTIVALALRLVEHLEGKLP